MKEDLVDYDGKTRLFKGRHADEPSRPAVDASRTASTSQALDLVDEYFPPVAQPLARMVYGKRAASSLVRARGDAQAPP